MNKKCFKVVMSILTVVLLLSMFPAIIAQAVEIVVKVLVEPKLEFYDVNSFHGGVAIVHADRNNSGIVDTTGEIIVPIGEYGSIINFSDGIAIVNKDNKRGAIDQTGKIVIPLDTYDWIGEFAEGLAWVKKDGKYGIVTTGDNATVKPATANPTSHKVLVNGTEVAFDAYNIDGSNYFKLRDVGQAFDFGVDWDSAKNTIIIDTKKGYTPDSAPTPAPDITSKELIPDAPSEKDNSSVSNISGIHAIIHYYGRITTVL